jgi:hypothetical protein
VLIGEVVLSVVLGYIVSIILKRILRIQDTKLKSYLQRKHPRFYKVWWSRYLEGKVGCHASSPHPLSLTPLHLRWSRSVVSSAWALAS